MQVFGALPKMLFPLPYQLTHEQEEEERRELQRLLSEDKPLKESVCFMIRV